MAKRSLQTILITGGNRGIGLEMVRQYLAAGANVIATARDVERAEALCELQQDFTTLAIRTLDVTDFAGINQLAHDLQGQPIDILINNAGMFGPKPGADNDPRQSFGSIDYDIWLQVLRTNTLAPVKLAEALFDNVIASATKKIVTISSIIGSFQESDSTLMAYPSSKVAVNMAMTALARIPAHESMTIVAMNPGWVQTDMGGPSATLTTEFAVTSIRQTIDKLTPARSGQFIDYDGREISR